MTFESHRFLLIFTISGHSLRLTRACVQVGARRGKFPSSAARRCAGPHSWFRASSRGPGAQLEYAKMVDQPGQVFRLPQPLAAAAAGFSACRGLPVARSSPAGPGPECRTVTSHGPWQWPGYGAASAGPLTRSAGKPECHPGPGEPQAGPTPVPGRARPGSKFKLAASLPADRVRVTCGHWHRD